MRTLLWHSVLFQSLPQIFKNFSKRLFQLKKWRGLRLLYFMEFEKQDPKKILLKKQLKEQYRKLAPSTSMLNSVCLKEMNYSSTNKSMMRLNSYRITWIFVNFCWTLVNDRVQISLLTLNEIKQINYSVSWWLHTCFNNPVKKIWLWGLVFKSWARRA